MSRDREESNGCAEVIAEALIRTLFQLLVMELLRVLGKLSGKTWSFICAGFGLVMFGFAISEGVAGKDASDYIHNGCIFMVPLVIWIIARVKDALRSKFLESETTYELNKSRIRNRALLTFIPKMLVEAVFLVIIIGLVILACSSETRKEMVDAILIGVAFLAGAIAMFVASISEIKVFRGKYTVEQDECQNKEKQLRNPNRPSSINYMLDFGSKRVRVSKADYDHTEIGDKYYFVLLYSSPEKPKYKYPMKKYEIDEEFISHVETRIHKRVRKLGSRE